MVPLNTFYFTNGEGYVPLILHVGSGVTWNWHALHFGSSDAIMAMDVSQGVQEGDMFDWFGLGLIKSYWFINYVYA